MDGDCDRVEYKYNRQSERIWTQDQNETVREFEYDKLGRRTVDKVTLPDPNTFNVDGGVLRIEHGYEVRGMLGNATSYSDGEGGSENLVNDVELVYDDFGNLIADHQEHDGAVNQDTLQVQYAHADGANNHARLNTVTYPNGRVLHHEYSSGNDSDLSRVSYLSETNSGGTQYAAYAYLGRGRIVKVDYTEPDLRYNLAFGSGSDPYDGLDRFGRVADLRWQDYGGETTVDTVRIRHGYDRAGNRLWREDTVSKSQETPVYLDERYVYDGMYQLTALQRGQLTAAEDALVAGSEEFAEQWTLDQLGNWSNVKSDDDGDGDWELDQARTHNKANEIATITGEDVEVAHDAAGNMTVAPKPEDWASHYHFIYDPWNRLVEVQTADQTKMVRAYEYDGLGRMISKWSYDEDAFSLSEWRHYYYSDRWQFLEERVADSYTGSYSGSGIPAMSGWGLSGSGIAGTFRLDRQFVWGLRYVNDLILRDRDTDSDGEFEERLYALQDPNWNVVAIANTSGVIQERYTYTAYGKPSFLTLAFAVRDPDVSSYDWETLYCGYRYDYHADSDVKWHIAGHRILLSHLGRWNRRDPIGYDAGDMNPSRYVGNSPFDKSDPLGLKIWTSAWDTIHSVAGGKLITWYIAHYTLTFDDVACTISLSGPRLTGAWYAFPNTASNVGSLVSMTPMSDVDCCKPDGTMGKQKIKKYVFKDTADIIIGIGKYGVTVANGWVTTTELIFCECQ